MENVIIVQRLEDGTVVTNIPAPPLVYHSPEGLDFGSNNPGTDDLALNMLHYALSTKGAAPTVDIGNGQLTYQRALDLHEWFALQALVFINPDLRQWQWSTSALLNWIEADVTN